MFYALPYKTKQFFFVLIKLSIVAGAFYFIYKKILENKDLEFSVFVHFLKENEVFSLKNILFLIILSGFNCFFEVIKWQKLVKSITAISFYQSLKHSFASLTASLITPNRIGEYGAKAMFFKKTQRKKVLFLNLIGNMSQMLSTLVFGCAGLTFLFINYNIEVDAFKIVRVIFIFVAIGVLTLFGLTSKPLKIRGIPLERLKKFWYGIPNSVKLTTIGLSFLRYLIFSFQFYYLLQIFGIEVYYLRAMIVITSMYLLASIIPTLSIFDVVIKGSIAVYLFTLVGVNEITILCIILLMWILNTVIPSIIGSFYVISFNFRHQMPS